MSVLVIDVGTTGVRSAIMQPDATLSQLHYRHLPPTSPFAGLVEFDPEALADVVVELATIALAEHGSPVTGIGITTQRASTVVWDRVTGVPVSAGLGWQDLRTVGECMAAKAQHGLALAPNQSATKIAWILQAVDPRRERDLCFGTVDSWLAWRLSNGEVHVTDRTNAAVTGLTLSDASAWSTFALDALAIPASMMPTIVDTSSFIGTASALPGAPPITALVGDQQGSLVGQSCVRPGDTKITFGTGGMLDVIVGPQPPDTGKRSDHGTFPIVAWARGGTTMWAVEGIMLSAGTNVDWLRDDLGIIETAAGSHDVAAACEHTDGVMYVPALLGLGTPHWDYGARGTLLGLTRGTGRPQVVRAVLEGIAHRGADLVEAAEADTGRRIERLRLDGGMSRNPTFVQAVADTTGRPVDVSPIADATTLGAGFLAGLTTGVWTSFDDIADSWRPLATIEPSAHPAAPNRERWADAIARSRRWIPELSALDF